MINDLANPQQKDFISKIYLTYTPKQHIVREIVLYL